MGIRTEWEIGSDHRERLKAVCKALQHRFLADGMFAVMISGMPNIRLNLTFVASLLKQVNRGVIFFYLILLGQFLAHVYWTFVYLTLYEI